MAGLNLEHRPSDSVHVERVWRSEGSEASHLLSVTNSHWELVIAHGDGGVRAAIRGPETRTSLIEMPRHDSAVGIVFAHGTAMPHLPVRRLVDSAVPARDASPRRVTLRGDVWELPTYENAEDFVAQLAAAGVLRRDPLVSDVAAGADDHGPTAPYGAAPGRLDDRPQPHLAHSLTRPVRERPPLGRPCGQPGRPGPPVERRLPFIGRTATELQKSNSDVPLSLLYKTPGWDRS
jgi:hypothetical protein